MKVMLEFDLPEERDTLEDILKVDDTKQVLDDIIEVLKICDREGKTTWSFDELYEMINKCLTTNGVIL